MVLPVLVAFTMALVWSLLVVAARIQCVDAARTGARAAARQDPTAAVVRVTRDAAPQGARVTVGRSGDQVRVTVVARPPVLSGLPFELREVAVAAAEDAVAAVPGGSARSAEGAPGTGSRSAPDEARGRADAGSGTAGVGEPGR